MIRHELMDEQWSLIEAFFSAKYCAYHLQFLRGVSGCRF
jgi:hypothetical protein